MGYILASALVRHSMGGSLCCDVVVGTPSDVWWPAMAWRILAVGDTGTFLWGHSCWEVVGGEAWVWV